MSIDDNQAVIQPQKGRREEALPPLAILMFTPQDIDLFLLHSSSWHKRSRKIYLTEVFSGSHEGVPLVLVGPMLGAPQTVLVLEKLIALGVTRVISVGWCGSLQTSVKIGDLVLPTGAFSDEGTSEHYPIEDPQPGPAMGLFSPLRRALAEEPLSVHEGVIWTTDAPFRETVKKVMHYQRAGALAVDMETSALFTVAAFRRVSMAVVLVVSDDLSELKWVHGFKESRFRLAREKLIESVLRVVSSITTQRTLTAEDAESAEKTRI